MLKKILASLLLFSLFFAISAPAVFAQTPSSCTDPNGDVLRCLTDIYCQRRQGNQVNLETWYGGKCDPTNPKNPEGIGFGDIIILDLYGKLTGEKSEGIKWDDVLKAITGDVTSYKNPQQLQAYLDKTLNPPGDKGGIAELAGLIGKMASTPPASTNEYVNYIANNINHSNPVQPAYAQGTGFGFQSIQAVLPIWRAFRNVSYLVFVLVFVIYGFLIMFRVKINAQTTANIQSALPKIAIVLLTITFSYAIVGLAIDLSYVVTGVLWSILTQANIIADYSGAFGGNFLAIHDGFAQFVSGRTWGLAGPMIAMLGHVISGDLVGRILAAFMPSILAVFLTTIGGGLIIGIIILITVFITLIRIAWMLLKAYVNLILATIFAPLWLLPGVMPGNNAFSKWLRGIVAELSIFVTTTMLFLFSFYFIGPLNAPLTALPLFSVGPLDTSHGLLIPPPLAGGSIGTTEGRFAILGFGLFLIIPGIADKIRKALQAPVLDFGTELGRGLGYGWWQFQNPGSVFRKSNLGAGIYAGATGAVTNIVGDIGQKVTGNRPRFDTAQALRDVHQVVPAQRPK